MNAPRKTNAVRLLDSLHIPYTLHPYPVEDEDVGAAHVALALGVPTALLFKTLVARGDKTGVLVCCVPGDRALELKALAQASGNKSTALVAMKEILPLTGYIRGGCSPLAMKKLYPTFIDQSIETMPSVMVSAGIRGMQIQLSPAHLINAIGASLHPLCQ